MSVDPTGSRVAVLTNATGKNKDQVLKDIDRDFYLGASAAKELVTASPR